MWNSPYSPSRSGKRYSVADLSALILPIDELLYLSHTEPIADLVGERILQRLDRGEFVYALYEVFEALTGDAPVPQGGHIGIHEAIIAELLHRSFDLVVCEIQMGEESESAREGVWQSVDRLLIQRNPYEPALPWMLEDAGMTLEDPESYQLENITLAHWEALLCGDSPLFSEFLWDEDWRMDSLMDLPPDTAKWVTDLAGLDLEVVQALPHTPDEAELRKAEDYLRGLIDQVERECQDRWPGQTAPGPEGWPDTPF
jgi:hypothetical protein